MTQVLRENTLREEVELIQQLKESIFYTITSSFRAPKSIKSFSTQHNYYLTSNHILFILSKKKDQNKAQQHIWSFY